MSSQAPSPIYTPCILQAKMPPWVQQTPSPSFLQRIPHERAGDGGLQDGPAASLITRDVLWTICRPHIEAMMSEVQSAVNAEFSRLISGTLDGPTKDDRSMASASGGATSTTSGRMRLSASSVSGVPAQRSSRSNVAAPFTCIFEPTEGGEEASPSTTPSAASSRPDASLTKGMPPKAAPPADAAYAAYVVSAAEASASTNASATSSAEGLLMPVEASPFSFVAELAATSPASAMDPLSVAPLVPVSLPATTPSSVSNVVPDLIAPPAPPTPAPPTAPPPPPPAPPQAAVADSGDGDKGRLADNRQDKSAARGEKSVMVCRHWKSKGWCRLEDGCKFLHPDHKRGTGAPTGAGNSDKPTTTTATITAPNIDAAASSTANANNAKSSRSSRRKAKTDGIQAIGAAPLSMMFNAGGTASMGEPLSADVPAQIMSADCYAAAVHDMAAVAGLMQAPPPQHLWQMQAGGFPQEQPKMTAALAASAAWGVPFPPYRSWGDPTDPE